MKEYRILTPDGIKSAYAETLYHAVQKVVESTGYKYSNVDLFKMNSNG